MGCVVCPGHSPRSDLRPVLSKRRGGAIRLGTLHLLLPASGDYPTGTTGGGVGDVS